MKKVNRINIRRKELLGCIAFDNIEHNQKRRCTTEKISNEWRVTMKDKLLVMSIMLIGFLVMILNNQNVYAACSYCSIGDHERCTSWRTTSNGSSGHKIQCCDGGTVFGYNVSHNNSYDWASGYTSGQCFRYKCSDCGYTSSWSGHNMSSSVTKAATCTSSGTRTYQCSRITSHSYTETIPSTGHSYGSWYTYSSPTCTSTGTSRRDCSNCSSYETKSIAKTGHSMGSWYTSVSPSCTSSGTSRRDCSNCSYYETSSISATGHSWSGWSTTKYPTCTATGTQTRTCSTCRTSESRSIAANGHSTSSTWSYDPNVHWKVCTVCSVITVSKEAHVDSEPNGICDVCNCVLDLEPPEASVNVSSGANPAKLTGTGTDNLGLSGYAWTTSSTEPTSWVTLNGETSTTQTHEVINSGNQYFWVKDRSGWTAYDSYPAYGVTYNANGGSSVPGAEFKLEGYNLTLTSEIAVRQGYTFLSWNTAADGSGTTYNPGDTYSADSNVTLYAQWKLNTFTSSLSQTEYTFDATSKTPIVTVKDGDTTLTEGTHYTVTMTGDKINIGTVAVSVKGINDYCWIEEMKAYTINPKNISDLTYEMSSEEYYNGLPLTPALTIKYGSLTLVKDRDYTFEYSNNTEIGTANVSVVGKGNYTGTKELTFEIVRDPDSTDYIYLDLTPPTISNIATEVGETVVISATIEDPNLVTGEPGSGVNTSATRYMITADDTTPDANDASWQESNSVAITLDSSGYVWIKAVDKVGNVNMQSVFVEFAISLNSSQITASLNENEYTYDGTDKTPTVTIRDTKNNYDLVENTDYTLEYKDNTNAGTGKVVLTGKGDYGSTLTLEFTIKKASSTITAEDIEVKANETINVTYTYNGDSTIANITSNNESIAKVGTIDISNKTFEVKAIGEGETTITISIPDGVNYAAQVATINVKVVDDITAPTITFTPNGSTGYVISGSTKVIVTDDKSGVDESTLKYLWTESTTEPNESSFVNSFTNGQTIEINSSNGTWFLWILAKDNYGNKAIVRSEAFYLDSEAPVGIISIHKKNNKWQNTNELTVDLMVEDNLADTSKIKVALVEAENIGNINENTLVWKDFAETATITASNTEGRKVIFAIFKDEAGNMSLSIN